jgi:hypothetical protein
MRVSLDEEDHQLLISRRFASTRQTEDRGWDVEAARPVHRIRSYATKSSWSLKGKMERATKINHALSFMSYPSLVAFNSQHSSEVVGLSLWFSVC